MPRQAPDTDPVLAARDLTKVYETADTTTLALDSVSLEIERGSFVSVMGPSGSGKSTLLHLMGGLDVPTSGEVFLDGQALSGLDDRELTLARRRSIGFVFQFFNLVPVLSVEENIALPAVIDGKRPDDYRDRLSSVLELVGIAETRTKLPSQISGGQQQRVAIARALFAAPAVLLADEPTGNLDSRTGEEILQVIQDVRSELAQSVVVVTHDPKVASHADEVLFIRDGRIGGHLNVADALKPKRTRRTPTGRRRGNEARRNNTPDSAGGGDPRTNAVLAWLQELDA